MKREILFRGKTKSGKWIYGMPTFEMDYIFNGDSPDSVDNYEVDHKTIGQFTGLIDKNGVKIFEGDKLRFEDDQESIVKWMQGGLTIEADFGDYDLTTVGWAIDILGSCEVIGNIHDNPDLL